MAGMRKVLMICTLVFALGACGSTGGGSAPVGGATTAPQASNAPMSPTPSGNPDADYGY